MATRSVHFEQEAEAELTSSVCVPQIETLQTDHEARIVLQYADAEWCEMTFRARDEGRIVFERVMPGTTRMEGPDIRLVDAAEHASPRKRIARKGL